MKLILVVMALLVMVISCYESPPSDNSTSVEKQSISERNKVITPRFPSPAAIVEQTIAEAETGM